MAAQPLEFDPVHIHVQFNVSIRQIKRLPGHTTYEIWKRDVDNPDKSKMIISLGEETFNQIFVVHNG